LQQKTTVAAFSVVLCVRTFTTQWAKFQLNAFCITVITGHFTKCLSSVRLMQWKKLTNLEIFLYYARR